VTGTEIGHAESARRIGLHPWRRLAERYGAGRPSRLKRTLVIAEGPVRMQWMRSVVALDRDRTGMTVHDYGGRSIVLNERIIEHIAPHPERAPYLPWLPFVFERPLEVWRQYRTGHFGLEPRLYYLFAAARPELHGVVGIVGERDLVAFNMIPIKPKNARKFRSGEPLYFGYDAPFGRCPHGCCEHESLA
jgi:phage-Barnase-EndoU-ColicinE5/D-RelE like nuclease2